MATQTEIQSQNRSQIQSPTTTLSFPTLPPFPDIPTAPLHRLSLSSLRTSPDESARFFESCKDLGFFYLDLRGDEEGEKLLADADDLFSLGPKLFDLEREELSKYDYKSVGSYAGYKGYGSAVVDEKGNLDRNEFYNIPKDDFFSISNPPFAHPQVLHANSTLIKSTINTSHNLVLYLLQHLNTHLALPSDTLSSLHPLDSPSGDQIRVIKAPPQPPSDSRTALGKHTDFGSLTLLFNRLGGLQILPPLSLVPAGQEPQWTYVRPLLGHCIVNIGDALTKLSGGLLRSNIHRVVSPPGEQAKETRWSVVYFARPGDEVFLRRLESDVIPKRGQDEGEEELCNAKNWVTLQAMRLRDVSNLDEEGKKKLWGESGRGK